MATRVFRTKILALYHNQKPASPQTALRLFSRPFATEAASSPPIFANQCIRKLKGNSLPVPFAVAKAPSVLTTIYSFPTMEPLRFESYPTEFLHAPLRRDILHRAVIYEGDSHRLGRAKTLWRSEVHGSSRKIRPQKGTGNARLGDRKSPMLRGGGVAHGPSPRDFSSGLPRKIYDLAWRIALSYRYRRNELVVIDSDLETHKSDAGLVKTILEQCRWGRDHNKSLLITFEKRANLEKAMGNLPLDGKVLVKEDVDVKDLLEFGRIVVELKALEWIRRKRAPE